MQRTSEVTGSMMTTGQSTVSAGRSEGGPGIEYCASQKRLHCGEVASVRSPGFVIAVLLLPLISMAIVPFYDTSEPRYAEIARTMAASGDWITPWFSPGVPFWGKPPLSFWAQALSIKAFGASEFAVRLPSWLCHLGSSGVLLMGLRVIYGLRIAVPAVIIYSSSSLVYLSSGAVLTDPFLALGTTLCLMSFAVSVTRGRPRWWRYGFFVGLVIGLLSKGPLAVVLSVTPVMIWYLGNRKTARLWSALPWRSGLALTAVLVLPWYMLAESRTPGFLNYFIVGEHLLRFLDSGWAGDLYGSAHDRAYATIWLYWLQASFPWGLLVLAVLLTALRRKPVRAAVGSVTCDPLFRYWVAGTLTAPCLFTFSANILWTYLLPSLAGFSVLTGLLIEELRARTLVSAYVPAAIAAFVPGAILILSLALWIAPDLRNTERTLIQYVEEQPGPPLPLLYFQEAPFSARFYSAGRARGIFYGDLKKAADCGDPFYLAIPKDRQSIIDDILDDRPATLFSNRRFILMKITPYQACNLADER